MEDFTKGHTDTETARIDESTYTERVDSSTYVGDFNIVLDVEIYHTDEELV